MSSSLKDLVNTKRLVESFLQDHSHYAELQRTLTVIKDESAKEFSAIFDDMLTLIMTAQHGKPLQNIINIIEGQCVEKANNFGPFVAYHDTIECNKIRAIFSVLPTEDKKKVDAVISQYVSWKYPALEIGPGDGIWTHLLQHAQPLVIADIHPEFIDSALSTLTQEAQNRIIKFSILKNNILLLPNNQFGFIFCWNLFNFQPLSLLQVYLSQCLQLLRPGGTFMFSFNNCDYPDCAERAELGDMHYTTEKEINELCLTAGFVDIKFGWAERYVTWAEVSKPGILSTAKTHPTIGIIKNI